MKDEDFILHVVLLAATLVFGPIIMFLWVHLAGWIAYRF